MASFAPKRVVIGAPHVPEEWETAMPQSFPLVNDEESLMDKTDLVFVDIIPGSGFSEAIAPHANQHFWGVEEDVKLSRDFIIRYVNANNRQASPKYLYGESYGGGTRVPKLARALLEAGTSSFETVPVGTGSNILNGVVFHSPAFSDFMTGYEEWFPTIVMTAETYGLPRGRDEGMSLDDYAQSIRLFMQTDLAAAEAAPTGGWFTKAESFMVSDTGKRFAANWRKFAGNQVPANRFSLVAEKNILTGISNYNSYDARMHLDNRPAYNFDFFEETALNNAITDYLPNEVNYRAAARYINASWDDRHNPTGKALASELWNSSSNGTGLDAIVASLGLNSTLKLLTLHGYYDTATLFYQTETVLKNVILDKEKNFTLLDRNPVKNFAGGHMIYYSDEARGPLKKTLDAFYDSPPYGSGPTIAKAKDLRISSPMDRSATTTSATTLH